MKKIFSALMMALCCCAISTAQFSEDFDTVITLDPAVATFGEVTASGMLGKLQSDPLGVTGISQGADSVFPAHIGAPTAYASMNFNNTAGATGVISTWLMTPELNLNDGDTWSLWTRTVTGSGFPDGAEIRLSTSGSSTDTGTAATDVGDFTTLLDAINPTLTVGGYPEAWTEFSGALTGVGTGTATGRLAFRYFVTSAGPAGANSNYIGVDTWFNSSTVVPEPSSLAMLLSIAGLFGIRRRL